MKLFVFIVGIGLLCSFGSYGQSIDLQFDPDINCELQELCADLQIRTQETEQTANIGSSSILFHYDTLSLDYKSYTPLAFDGSANCLLGLYSVWEDHGIDGESNGTFNITLNLGVNINEEDAELSCPTIENDWINIGKICFDLTGDNPETDSLLWFSQEANFISFNNFYPNDGNNQLDEGNFNPFVSDIGCDLEAPPSAHFLANTQTGFVPLSVEFDASSSFDNDGNIVDYAWDFGDGNTTTGITTSHIFEEVGTYTVTLTVTDNEGLMDITQEIFEVLPPPIAPEAIFVMMNTPEGAAPFTIMLSATESSDEDGVIVSYFWDFGDGITAFGLNAIHTYPMPGEYQVSLTVTDSQGLTDEYTETINVTEGEAPPEAGISASTVYGEPPLEITFNGSESFDPNGELIEYHWFFGDGMEDLGEETMHTFSQSGTYTVTLVVTDDEGLMAMATETITVVPPAGNTDDLGMPHATITIEEYSPIVPTMLELSATESVDSIGEIIAYEWFVDGLLLSTTEELNLSVLEPGESEIVLNVFDDDNQTSSDTLSLIFEEDTTLITNCDTTQQTITETYLGSICAGEPSDLNTIWNFDSENNNITWTDENGNTITNPESFIVENWNCTIEQTQLTSSFTSFDEATCTYITYSGTHSLTVYPEIIATMQALADDCGVELTTCSGYEVTWTDESGTQDGNIYTTDQSAGQVTFTVTNPLAPASCNTKTFQGYYYCTIDLEVTLIMPESNLWSLGEEVPVEIMVTNKGSIDATNVYIQQTFSKQVQVSNPTPAEYYNETDEIWSIPTLEANATKEFSFFITPIEIGEIEVAAWVEWADENDIDSYPGNTNTEEDDYATFNAVIADSLLLACDEICSTITTCTPALTPLTICPDYCLVEGEILIEDYVSVFNCTVTQLEDGCFRYMPLPGMEDAPNPDNLTVVARGENGNCETLMFDISVGDCNGNPIAVNDYVVTPKNTAINIYVLSNDTDPEEEGLYVCGIVVAPSFGTVEIVPEGLQYVPNNEFVGSDVMAYEVCDATGASSIAFAYVVVHETGDCESDVVYACVSPGELVTLCPNFCGFNNSSPFESLTVTEGGLILDVENGCFRYRPSIDFEGFEEIEAVACYDNDNVTFCETVRYVVNVNNICLPNATSIPYITDDYDTTTVNTTILIDALANDDIPIGTAVEICDVADPYYGTATITEDGLISYTPNDGYIGEEIFGYTVCDAQNNTGYGFILITVEPGDPCDIAMETCTGPLQAVEVCLEFCGPDFVITETHTTFDCGIQLLSDQCVRYQPLPGFIGTDTIHVQYCNPEGECLSATVDVHVTPNCPEDGERYNQKDEFCQITFPNVLTPNQDGINDVISIGQWALCYPEQEASLRIFDPYGRTVFETNQIIYENATLWNGEYLNTNSFVSSGVYYYHLQVAQEAGLTNRTGFFEVRLR